MKLLDPDHPMFRRAWVRWATVLVPLAWGAFELWLAWGGYEEGLGNPGWAVLFGAAGAYAFWVLILRR